jgi:hypothetical protein
MNRRKAIFNMLGFSATIGAASYCGVTIYNVYKRPNLKNLDDYKEMLASLVEIIIPETDTPGAGSAGVYNYVLLMIKEAKSRKEQNNFINGLNDIRDYCLNNYNKQYEQCSFEEKTSVLNYFESIGSYTGLVGKIKNKLLGVSFFQILKSLTIEGYCTSEIGATKHLAYQMIPGKYIAQMDLKPNQKAWATK